MDRLIMNLKEFKQIDYNNNYLINKEGKVYSLYTNKFIKPTKSKSGYLYITFNDNKKIRLHRLIALAFIPNPNNYLEINHIDGNKENNNINNLEWCSREQNRKHAIKLGLLKCKENVKQKFMRKDVTKEKCLELQNKGYKKYQIAKILNCSTTTIWKRFKEV